MGDFHQQFHRPNAGSHTVEGNVSGSRAAMLERKRQAQQEEFEAEKKRKRKQMAQDTLTIANKFQPARIGTTVEGTVTTTSHTSSSSTQSSSSSSQQQQQQQQQPRTMYGLVTAQEFKEIQQEQRGIRGGGEGDSQMQHASSAITMIRSLQSTATKAKREQLSNSNNNNTNGGGNGATTTDKKASRCPSATRYPIVTITGPRSGVTPSCVTGQGQCIELRELLLEKG